MSAEHTPKPTTISNAPWGRKCLSSERPRPSGHAYSDMPGYRHDAAACGQGVTICVLDETVFEEHVGLMKPIPAPTEEELRLLRIQLMKEYDEFEKSGEGPKKGNSHGTFVASVARGVAPQATIKPILFLGWIYMIDEVAEVITLADSAPVVLNISIATDGRRAAKALVKLIKKGVHVVVAAGNNNLLFPAPSWSGIVYEGDELLEVTEDDKNYLKSIVWVGASTPEDKRWGSSAFGDGNGSVYGPLVDLFAPGEGVEGAVHGKEKYAREKWNGTSFAAPLVTGIIACLLSHPKYRELPPREMKEKILAMAWEDAIQDAPVLDLVKQTLTRELSTNIKDFRNKNEAARKELFKDAALKRVKAAYYQEHLLPKFTEITNGLNVLKDEIYSTLEMTHTTDSTVNDFKTTGKLASCLLSRWGNGDN